MPITTPYKSAIASVPRLNMMARIAACGGRIRVINRACKPVKQRHINRHATAALVMNGFINGLGTIRSLAQAGNIPIILVCKPGDIAAASRYVDQTFYYRDDGELIAALKMINSRYEQVIAFPCVDRNIKLLALLANEINNLKFPSIDLRILEKTEQIKVAQHLAIPCPKTIVITDQNELGNIDLIDPPYVLKPTSSCDFALERKPVRVKPFVTSDKGVLQERLASMINNGIRCMVSEYVPGLSSVYSYCGYAVEGQVKCRYLGLKVIEGHPTMVAAIAESVPLDQETKLTEAGDRYLATLRLTGIFELEFKKCSRTGQVFFIEVNPRTWLWNELATADGMNASLVYFFNEADQISSIPMAEMSSSGVFVWAAGTLSHMVKHRTIKPLFIILSAMFSPNRRLRFALLRLSDPNPFFRVLVNHLLYMLGRRAKIN